MVEYQESTLDAVFRALADPTRRRMLARLTQGERTVGELAEPFAMSLAAASKHIRALEAAALVDREVRGRRHVCRLNAAPLSAASDWLRHYERFWSGRLDQLEQLLRQTDAPPKADASVRTGGSTSPARDAKPRSRSRTRGDA